MCVVVVLWGSVMLLSYGVVLLMCVDVFVSRLDMKCLFCVRLVSV